MDELNFTDSDPMAADRILDIFSDSNQGKSKRRQGAGGGAISR